MTQPATDHRPEPWYEEAEGDNCPHGPEPEDDTTDAWDIWQERHQWSPQDVRICLDAPVGDHCAECSADQGDPVPWAACRNRSHAQAREIPPFPQHQPVLADAGPLECWDRECEKFFTEEGDEIPGMTTCSDIKQMEICAACSEPAPGEAEEFPAVVLWADCPVRKTPGQHAQGAS